jgi:hypothetical protein
MSLWNRAPREVYRVYGEDQYREGETAPEGETVAQEAITPPAPDSRARASWATLATDVSPASPGTSGSSSAPPRGLHTGRLIGAGLLMGVGFATLALVFLNMSHRHGAAPVPVGQGDRVKVEQGRGHVSGTDRARGIERRVNSRPIKVPSFSAPSLRTPIRVSRQVLQRRAPAASESNTAPPPERAWSAALRAPGNGASAMVGIELPTLAVVKPPAQDEFGFEQ